MANTWQDIPLAADLISDSQDDLRQNFAYLNTILGNDHQIAFLDTDTTAGEGRHKKVSLLTQAMAPAYVAAQNYNNAIWADSTNFYWQTGAGATNIRLSNQQGTSLATNGYSFLPGDSTNGLLIQWGTSPAASVTSRTVNFPVAFSATPFNIQITGLRAGSNPGNDNEFWVVTGFSSTQFDIFNKGAHSFAFMWVAIGTK